MLDTNTIMSTLPLAEQFDAKGVILRPLAGWPLHHLVEATNATPDMACVTELGEVVIDDVRLMNAANNKEANYDQSRHTYAMADFVDAGKRAVLGALNVARTQAAPRIVELLELVTMRMTNAPVSDLTKMKIEEEEDCSALYAPQMRKLVDQFANWQGDEPLITISGAMKDESEILALLDTGIGSIDDMVKPWAAGLDKYVLTDTFQMFFTLENQGDRRGFIERLSNDPTRMLLVFLIARHLLENDIVLEDVTIPLAQYKGTLTTYVAQTSFLLNVQMDRNEQALKNETIVRSVSFNTIKVFAPTYRKWLENGGDSDVLYGMAVAGGMPSFTLDAIIANSEKYLAAWRQFSAVATSRESVQRYNYLREQLILCYENIIARPTEEGEQPDPNAVKAEMDKFAQELNQVKVTEMEDLHAVCRRLVCRTAFYNTPSETLLERMDEEAKRNPKLSPREAGAMATLWYISKWVASQIEVASA